MGELRVTVPKELQKALNIRAIKEDKTLRNLVVELLEQAMKIKA